MLGKPVKNVVWSDELKFKLFSARMVKLWSGKHHVKNSIQTVQFLRSSRTTAQLWFGAVSAVRELENCVLARIMDRFYYQDILEQNLQPSINHFKLGRWCIFMHDNDLKHTSGLIKDWLKRKRIQTLPWPPHSQNFNTIENLWDKVERRVKKHQPKNITQPELLLIQEWNQIELPVLEKLVDYVPSRLHDCIKMKDYPTKYELSFI